MKLPCCVMVCGMILLTCPVWPESTGKQVSVKNPKQEVLNLEDHWLQVEDFNAEITQPTSVASVCE